MFEYTLSDRSLDHVIITVDFRFQTSFITLCVDSVGPAAAADGVLPRRHPEPDGHL